MTKELNETEMRQLCRVSFDLLQTLSNIYGSDQSMKMFEQFETVLGKEVKSNIFLYMLDSTFNSGSTICFGPKPGGFSNFIELIKAIREFGNNESNPGVYISLKDAKDLADSAKQNGHVSFRTSGPAARQNFLDVLHRINGEEK